MLKTDNKIASYQAEFANFLRAEKYAFLAVKSMVDDLSHFFSWVAKSTNNPRIIFSQHNFLFAYFEIRALEQYFSFCQENFTNTDLIRRVKSIQKFVDFAVANKWLSDKQQTGFIKLAKQAMDLLKNHNQELAFFTQFLKKNGMTKNTLRSYVTDIKEFLIIN